MTPSEGSGGGDGERAGPRSTGVVLTGVGGLTASAPGAGPSEVGVLPELVLQLLLAHAGGAVEIDVARLLLQLGLRHVVGLLAEVLGTCRQEPPAQLVELLGAHPLPHVRQDRLLLFLEV